MAPNNIRNIAYSRSGALLGLVYEILELALSANRIARKYEMVAISPYIAYKIAYFALYRPMGIGNNNNARMEKTVCLSIGKNGASASIYPL